MANKLAEIAMRNRREIIKAGLSRRDLFKMGLLSSTGYLIGQRGLSAQASGGQTASPPTRAFFEPLPRLRIKQPMSTALNPAPTELPNTAAGEARTRAHQRFREFPAQKFYEIRQMEAKVSVSPDLPLQTMWGYDGLVPGPLYVGRYGEPVLVRNWNNLPAQNGGFGLSSVSTHLHNGHVGSESDGFPCDFFDRGKFYDHHYPNVLAGFASDHAPTGDINEAMSTLWYHDHRVDFTSQNVYKGIAGMFLLFNQFDTGDETTGFRLPSGLGADGFDVPMMFADKVFDPTTGVMYFDLFNLDGIIGDKFTVNGKIQPVLHVHPRRYRFRWLDVGPSRFYELFLTDLNNPGARNLFWQISSDGNLLPRPIAVESVQIGVAERADVIVDFSRFAGKTLYLENRLEQIDGRRPTGTILPAGSGNLVLQIVVDLPRVADDSQDPAGITKFYDLPNRTSPPVVTRMFRFNRSGGQWTINGKFFDCNEVRFRVKQNTVEHWILENNAGGWWHPIHIHFEEFQILSRDGAPPPIDEVGRKDVVKLRGGSRVELLFRFRDFLGRYPMHCHNVVHEDHAMMLRFEVDTEGDRTVEP